MYRTKKLVNKRLFKECLEKIKAEKNGKFNRLGLIIELLNKFDNKELEIKTVFAFKKDEECYGTQDTDLIKVQLNKFIEKISIKYSLELKDYQALDILMHNYLLN
jgi:hypothetical protein